jgi:uncharacterized protein YbjT (DUF2867 family)
VSEHGPNGAHGEILVLGATGKTGRRVAERLRTRGAALRAGSRSGEPRFDWEDRATWEPALAGASAVYVSYYPDLAAPGAAEAVGDLSRLAVELGVRRLVLLSGRGEPEAERAERALQASGAEWTVVRSAWFAQNFSESFFREPVLAGEVALPADAVREPFIDADDIADVASAALLEPGHAGELYEVTGPRLLRFGEAVEEIARATGRPIAYTPISIEAFAAGLVEAGVPEEVVGLLVFLFTDVLDGRNAEVADGVQRALGREPRDFRDFARRAAATGAWGRAAAASAI